MAVHNKSGLTTLSLMNWKVEDIKKVYSIIQKNLSDPVPCSINPSKCCKLYKTEDGRASLHGRKVYAYEVIAYMKFGRESLSRVAASKVQSDIVISHLCGTRACCTAEHLALETKEANDTRTHCHFCLRQMFNAFNIDQRCSAEQYVIHFHEMRLCPHIPKCGIF